MRHPYDDSTIQYDDGPNEFYTEADDTEHRISRYYVEKSRPKYEDYTMPHAIWTREEMDNIQITHKEPERKVDKLALFIVKFLRFQMDWFSGYTFTQLPGFRKVFKLSSNLVLRRSIILESVAGVPGMMFGMVRHLNSLRRLQRDRGWIKTLLSEAENERMHLLVCVIYIHNG